MIQGAHGVVASHPLRMRKALGSNPSVSIYLLDKEFSFRWYSRSATKPQREGCRADACRSAGPTQ